jgi:very-short-patch-repair endonuclease
MERMLAASRDAANFAAHDRQRLQPAPRGYRGGAPALIRLRHLCPRLTRQLPIGDIIDFARRTIKLAIEIDGSQHLDAEAYDARRTAFSKSLAGV